MKLNILVLILLFTISCKAVDDPYQTREDPTMALKGIADLEFVAWVTGPKSINETDQRYDIHGTDLGSMFASGDTLYIAFGDTFSCCRPPAGGAGGENWRFNALAYATDTDPENGITFDGMIVDEDGKARAVLQKGLGDVTIIPTSGVAVDNRLYLHYMAVKKWGDPGHWTLNRSGWGYSDDRGVTWVQPEDATWEGDTNFGQAAIVQDGGYIYILGIPGGRFGGVAIARVLPDDLLDLDKYAYWDGGAWIPNGEEALEIVPAPVGELSVAWNAYLERWIMTYLDETRRAIVIREAANLVGPWGDPIELVSANEYPALYGAYLHPWASDGEVVYFNMSQWAPYNVLLMRARLVK
jgi:hypothetical protein